MAIEWLPVATHVVTGIVAGVAAAFSMARRQERLEDEVRVLRDDKFAGLNQRVGKIEDRCRAEQNAADVHNIVGWMKRLDGTLALLTERSTSTAASVEALKTWVQNLNNDFGAHHRDRSIHGSK